jgi:hypothetical protein
VFKWRLQAEEKMRASGKPGMTDEQVGRRPGPPGTWGGAWLDATAAAC